MAEVHTDLQGLPYLFPWDAHIWWGYEPAGVMSPQVQTKDIKDKIVATLPVLEDFPDHGDIGIVSMYLPVIVFTFCVSLVLLAVLCFLLECLRSRESTVNRTSMPAMVTPRGRSTDLSQPEQSTSDIPDTPNSSSVRSTRPAQGTPRRRRPFREWRPSATPKTIATTFTEAARCSMLNQRSPEPDASSFPRLRISQFPQTKVSTPNAGGLVQPNITAFVGLRDDVRRLDALAATPLVTPSVGGFLGKQVRRLASHVGELLTSLMGEPSARDGSPVIQKRKLRFVRAWYHNKPLSTDSLKNLPLKCPANP